MTANEADNVATVDISVVIPLYNEQENVVPLYKELTEVMSAAAHTYEVVFVDDGSSDQTVPRLREAIADDPHCVLVELNRNFGQTAALAAGIRHGQGRFIVPMDGDMQNDPRDIEALVAKLEEPPGFDVVSGWRKNRQDKFISRRLPSILANRLISKLTWTPIHDFGCTLKAYRREVLEDVHLYGEMHRFLPAIAGWRGARINEMVVNHRPRTRGTSKYGLKRTVKVLLDLLTVKFLGGYLTKPLYFFGKVAMWPLLVSFLSLFVAILQKFNILTEHGQRVMLNDNVLVLFAMMLFLMACMFIVMGVLAELLVRIYHEGSDRPPYKVRRITRGG